MSTLHCYIIAERFNSQGTWRSHKSCPSMGTFRTGLCPTSSFTLSHVLQTFVFPQVKDAFRVAARLLSSSSPVATPDTEKDVLVCGRLLLVFTVPALKLISTSIRERSLAVRADFWLHLI